jgi:hypothetical protein
MNLKDAQRLEKSLRYRAGSLSTLSRGYTGGNRLARSNYGRQAMRLSENMEKILRNQAMEMGNLAREIDNKIEQVLQTVEVDI